jgi:hypothetical protein
LPFTNNLIRQREDQIELVSNLLSQLSCGNEALFLAERYVLLGLEGLVINIVIVMSFWAEQVNFGSEGLKCPAEDLGQYSRKEEGGAWESLTREGLQALHIFPSP